LKITYENERREELEEYYLYDWNGKELQEKMLAKCSFCLELYDWDDMVHICSMSKTKICKNCSTYLCDDCLKINENNLRFLFQKKYSDDDYYFLEFLFRPEDKTFLEIEIEVIDTAEVYFYPKESYNFRIRYSDLDHFLSSLYDLHKIYDFRKDEYAKNQILRIINELREKLKVEEKTPTE